MQKIYQKSKFLLLGVLFFFGSLLVLPCEIHAQESDPGIPTLENSVEQKDVSTIENEAIINESELTSDILGDPDQETTGVFSELGKYVEKDENEYRQPIAVTIQNVEFQNGTIDLDVSMINNTKDFISGLRSTLSIFKGDALLEEGYLFADLDFTYAAGADVQDLAPGESVSSLFSFDIPSNFETGNYFVQFGVTDREIKYHGINYFDKPVEITGSGGFLGDIEAFVRSVGEDQALMSGQLLGADDEISVVIPLAETNGKLKDALSNEDLYFSTSIRSISTGEILKSFPLQQIVVNDDEIINTLEPWDGMPTGALTIMISIVDKDKTPVANEIFARWFRAKDVARIAKIVSGTNYYKKDDALDLKVVGDFFKFDEGKEIQMSVKLNTDNGDLLYDRTYVFLEENEEEVEFDFSDEHITNDAKIESIEASLIDPATNEVLDNYTLALEADDDYVSGVKITKDSEVNKDNNNTASKLNMTNIWKYIIALGLVVVSILIIVLLGKKSRGISIFFLTLAFLGLFMGYFLLEVGESNAACPPNPATCYPGFTPNTVWATYSSASNGYLGLAPKNIVVSGVYAHMSCNGCLNGVHGTVGIDVRNAANTFIGQDCEYLGDPGHLYSWKPVGDPARYIPPGPFTLSYPLNSAGNYHYRVLMRTTEGCKCLPDDWFSAWRYVQTGTKPIAYIDRPYNGENFYVNSSVPFRGHGWDADGDSFDRYRWILRTTTDNANSNYSNDISVYAQNMNRSDLPPDSYYAFFAARDIHGHWSSWKYIRFNIIDRPPTANITSPSNGQTFHQGDPVTLTGNGHDPDGDSITSYRWGTSCGSTNLGAAASVTNSTLTSTTGTKTIFFRVYSRGSVPSPCVSRSVNVISLTCTGSDPDPHASLCTGDSTGLTSNTAKDLVATCSSPGGSNPKCQYTCNSGYEYDSVTDSCRVATCTGSDPDPNAILCTDDGTGLSADTAKDLVATCSSPSGSNPKCQYTCKSGYEYDPVTDSCRVATCTGSDPDPNAILCTDDGTGLSADTAKDLVATCSSPSGSNPKCQYTCNSGFEYDPVTDSCRVATCTGSDPDPQASLCTGDGTGLTSDTAKDLVATCSSPDGSNPKCQYTCKSGYEYDPVTDSCRVATCTGSDPDPNAILCTDDGTGLSADTAKDLVATCSSPSGSSPKCQYVCDSDHVYNSTTDSCDTKDISTTVTLSEESCFNGNTDSAVVRVDMSVDSSNTTGKIKYYVDCDDGNNFVLRDDIPGTSTYYDCKYDGYGTKNINVRIERDGAIDNTTNYITLGDCRPKVSKFEASAYTIAKGESVQLIWEADYSNWCWGSSTPGGLWNSHKPSEDDTEPHPDTVAPTETTTYQLYCGNNTVTPEVFSDEDNYVVIEVIDLEFDIDPSFIPSGNQTEIKWKPTNMDSCEASSANGDWVGIKAHSDLQHTETITPTLGNSYTIKCSKGSTKSITLTENVSLCAPTCEPKYTYPNCDGTELECSTCDLISRCKAKTKTVTNYNCECNGIDSTACGSCPPTSINNSTCSCSGEGDAVDWYESNPR